MKLNWKIALLFSFVFSSLSGLAFAQSTLEVVFWMPEVQAKAKSSTDVLPGTTIDFDSDLDLEFDDDVMMYRLSLGGQQRVNIQYYVLEMSGKQIIQEDFDFGGETYTVGTKVDSEIKLDVYRVTWESDWLSSENFRFGTIVGTNIIEAQVSVKNDLVGSEDFDKTFPVPLLGVHGYVGATTGFGAYGEVAGLYLGYGEFEGGYIEWEAGITWSSSGGAFFIKAGYREMIFELSDEDNELDLELKGYIFGAGFLF
jgi:hypothetical protein